MYLRADARNIILNQPNTVLTAAATAGDTAITVANNGGFVDNDYILIGKLGEEKSEIKKITTVGSTKTSIGTIAALSFSHDQDTPVSKIGYDQVRFYHGTTTTSGDSSALAAAQDIEPSEIFNYYEDTAHTTGYGFVRFHNSTTTDDSVYSDAIPYTGYTAKMLRSMRKKVRRLINEVDEQNSPITNEEIDDELNMANKEVNHDRLWSFSEKTKSFSSVANQYEYSLASNVFKVYDAMFKTQPLAITDLHRWEILRWDTFTTSDPTHICMWGNKARVYPYPSSSAETTTLGAAVSTTTSTTFTVADASSFPEQGRAIVDSEVFSWTGKTGTTSLTGITRGEEGTTAATHSNGATITERDFIYHFQEEPDDLKDETDETAVSEPSAVVYRAAAECALNLDKETLHDRLLGKYERAMAQLRKVDEPKIKRSFGRVKDMNQVVDDMGSIRNPNDFPTSLS
jgi:hypothetical protein